MMSVLGFYTWKVQYIEVNLLLVSCLFVAALIGGVRWVGGCARKA